MAWTPNSSSSARMSAGDDGDPPMISWRRLERSKRRPFAAVEDGVEDGRDAQQARHPVPLDVLHERDRVEPAEHDVPSADQGHEVRHAPAVDVEHRHDVQDHVVLAEAERDLGVERVEVELRDG